VAFIEVKRAATKLGAKCLRQVQMYAVNEGVKWMILTNGQVWQAWHLTAGCRWCSTSRWKWTCSATVIEQIRKEL